METTEYQPAVELYVRSMCPRGAHQRQERVIERLEALRDDERIADLSIVVWGDRMALDTVASRTGRGERILERIDEFRQWARSENVSMSLLERVDSVENATVDASFTAIKLPVMCLVELVDDSPTHVTPHTDADAVTTVEDRLTAIADGDDEAVGTADPDGPRPA